MQDRSDVSPFFDAGADAVVFNAPLGQARAEAMVEALCGFEPDTVVDLGCGRGALACMVASRLPASTVIGVDTDERSIGAARARAKALALGDRVGFEVADAATWVGPADAALCVGASHAFGGVRELLSRLGDLAPSGVAIVGDAVYQATPDQWCLETFGPLPDGIQALAREAGGAGWTVVEAETSTLAEWDDFEQTWIEGVRSLGTDDAVAFADERERYYWRYRGVLGFGWLVLDH